MFALVGMLWLLTSADIRMWVQVRVVAAEGDMQGDSRIVDLHNGLYEVFYTAPATGTFLLHVEYADAGVNPVPVGIRGSPFAVQCTDPWSKLRVLGALPARRQVGYASFTFVKLIVAC